MHGHSSKKPLKQTPINFPVVQGRLAAAQLELVCDVQGQRRKCKTNCQLKPGVGGLETKIAAEGGIHHGQVCLWSGHGALQEGDAITDQVQHSLLRSHILLSLPPPDRGTAVKGVAKPRY